MEHIDYRSPEGKELSAQGAKQYMASLKSDPEKWKRQVKAMQEGRKKTFQELKMLRELKKSFTAQLPIDSK